MRETVLSVRNLTKKYGNKVALNNISIDINRGEIVGLLGHNGAGKTTLIKSITGLLKCDDGKIIILGENANTNYSKLIGRVGLLIEPAFYDFLSAYDNLKVLMMANSKSKNLKEKIMESLEFVGLSNVCKDKIGTFSYGMKQRLGLAQALMEDPEIIILDEPTTGLDPMGIEELKVKLKDLTLLKKTTILFSSHQLTDVEDICEKIILLKEGNCLVNEYTNVILGNKEYVFQIQNLIDKDMFMKCCIKNNLNITISDEKIIFLSTEQNQLNILIKTMIEQSIDIIDIKVNKDSLAKLFITDKSVN